MNIVRLTYASRLSKDMGPEALGKIIEVSRRNNKKLGITGALCYSPRGFLQILEGPADTVNELYRRIVQDSRHAHPTLIEYARVHFREFESWSMAYVRTRRTRRRPPAQVQLRIVCSTPSSWAPNRPASSCWPSPSFARATSPTRNPSPTRPRPRPRARQPPNASPSRQ
jgi:hypothetical protein